MGRLLKFLSSRDMEPSLDGSGLGSSWIRLVEGVSRCGPRVLGWVCGLGTWLERVVKLGDNMLKFECSRNWQSIELHDFAASFKNFYTMMYCDFGDTFNNKYVV